MGQNDDGHESSSTTTVTRASNINPGYANFITQTDWTTVDSSGADRSSALWWWYAWYLSSRLEYQLRQNWKMTPRVRPIVPPHSQASWNCQQLGYRQCSSGSITLRGSSGYYWSSTTPSAFALTSGHYLLFNSSSSGFPYTKYGNGFSVRCIKD